MSDEHDCPACGCNEWKVLRSSTDTARMFNRGWITQMQRTVIFRACGHCGHRWRTTEQKPVSKAEEMPGGAEASAERRRNRPKQPT